MAELFDFCCANGWSIVGVSLGTIRTSYSDVGVKITFSLYGDISNLNSFNIHGQNASNTKWRALCNFKRERPTKSLFIQRTESIGWELNQHFHNQFYQIDLNNASSVTSTSISTYISVSASMEHHINHHINPGIFQHLRRSTAAWGIGAAPQKDSESWSQDVPRAWA